MHGSWRCWVVGLAAALPVGCRTIAPDKARSEPIAQLLPPADRKEEPPVKDLPADESGRVCMAYAEELAKNGDEVQAILLYEKARKNDPKSHVSRRLAVLYDRQGDFQKAQEEYHKALKQDPRDADLLNNMGYGYYSRGRWTEAELYLRQALAVKPKHPEATMNLGLCVGAQGRYAEALELFEKAATRAQARCNLAFVLTTQHKWPEAKRTYQAALQIDPDIPLARAALAKLDKAEQQAPAAVQTAQTPGKPEGNFAMGYVQFDDAGDDKAAVQQATQWTSAPAAPVR